MKDKKKECKIRRKKGCGAEQEVCAQEEGLQTSCYKHWRRTKLERASAHKTVFRVEKKKRKKNCRQARLPLFRACLFSFEALYPDFTGKTFDLCASRLLRYPCVSCSHVKRDVHNNQHHAAKQKDQSKITETKKCAKQPDSFEQLHNISILNRTTSYKKKRQINVEFEHLTKSTEKKRRNSFWG